jgi:hypothetical protein
MEGFFIMWRRDVCMWSAEHWGSTPEDWERRAEADRRAMACTVAQVRAAGWGDVAAGQAVRDVLENIEICSVNVELLNRTGSFDDPAWVERRARAAVTRLEATTDPVLLPAFASLSENGGRKSRFLKPGSGQGRLSRAGTAPEPPPRGLNSGHG